MKTRCYNPNATRYSSWGGRGIRVCDKWLNSFDAFLADMGPRPADKTSLDRYPDNDGNYEVGNVRWATAKEQALNRRPKTVKPKKLKWKRLNIMGLSKAKATSPKTNLEGFNLALTHFYVDGQSRGAQSRMAFALGVSRAVVEAWSRNGIPPKYIPKLKQLTGLTGRQMQPETATIWD